MLNIILRTCSLSSLQSNRIFPKNDTIRACYNALIDNLIPNAHLHIIDDNSDQDTINHICSTNSKNISVHLIKDKPQEYNKSPKLKSRYSLKIALDYIKTLNPNDLVYLVEDDYLHYPNQIQNLFNHYQYFTNFFNNEQNIAIFPQDFNQLYYDPYNNQFNETYIKPTYIFPGIDRYYQKSWFSQESFFTSVFLIHKYQKEFDSLLDIGTEPYIWEGSTISNVWQQPDVMLLMPLKTHAIHLGALRDISYFCDDWQNLYYQYLNKHEFTI